jgi:hypothetical protein
MRRRRLLPARRNGDATMMMSDLIPWGRNRSAPAPGHADEANPFLPIAALVLVLRRKSDGTAAAKLRAPNYAEDVIGKAVRKIPLPVAIGNELTTTAL